MVVGGRRERGGRAHPFLNMAFHSTAAARGGFATPPRQSWRAAAGGGGPGSAGGLLSSGASGGGGTAARERGAFAEELDAARSRLEATLRAHYEARGASRAIFARMRLPNGHPMRRLRIRMRAGAAAAAAAAAEAAAARRCAFGYAF